MRSLVASQPASQPASLYGVNKLPSKLPVSETLSSPDMVIPQSDIQRQLALVTMELAEMKQTQARFFENEIPHMQAAQQLGALGVPTVWIVVGAIALIVLLLHDNKPCNCETTQKKAPVSFAMSVLSRFANKAADKAGNVLFG